jgi:hypothetical protein
MDVREVTSVNERLTVVGLAEDDLKELKPGGILEFRVTDYHSVVVLAADQFDEFLEGIKEDVKST